MMADGPEDYSDFDDDLEGLSPEEEALENCMLSPDGQCGAAGSEWCDWECPMRDSEFFAGSKAWIKAHSKAAADLLMRTPYQLELLWKAK